MKNNTQSKKERLCQYNYSNCQKIATAQHILKLGIVTIKKNLICDNCYQQIQKNPHNK